MYIHEVLWDLKVVVGGSLSLFLFMRHNDIYFMFKERRQQEIGNYFLN